MGISYEEFWHMNPHILDTIAEGHNLKMKMQDEQMWSMGLYVKSAVFTAVDHALNGRKAKSEYIKEPIMQSADSDKGRKLTEDEKQKAVDLFFKRENARRINWKLSHPKDK